MRLLLDTHIILWAQLDPDRIPARIGSALQNVENELWFSPISVWEVLQLIQRGRLEVKGDVYKWTDQVFDGLHEALLNRHVAVQSRRIELTHNDPADRFIAATAQVYDLSLVTLDSKLLESQGLQVFR
ncbi:MAG: type II toxin-antitoxin system VapC family toxin [Deltaproteobacteria bacterium]|nr:type II toxin-antitoxin system VapC family toxin [Deltaproteobacteria bacterium]